MEQVGHGMADRSAEVRDLHGIKLSQLIATLWRRKWIVIASVLVCLAGSFAYALLKQPRYTAVATLIPVGNVNQGSSLSQYASIASSLGLALPSLAGGAAAPDQEIMAILRSRTLCERLVRELSLESYLVKNPEKLHGETPLYVAVRKLRTNDLSVSEDTKTGVISIHATLFNRQMAGKIANRAVAVLESILNQQNAALSAQSTKTLESQIREQSKKVRELQDQLANFQKNTKIISPQGQVTGAISLYGNLLQQKLALEVVLSRLQNALSSDNPQVTAAKAQLAAVNDQISKLEGTIGVGSFSMGNAPDQIVKYQNISGELDVASKIYASLLAAYENQKLQLAQNQVFVQVIDPAIVPERPSRPNKKLIVAIGFLLGALLGVLFAFLVEAMPELRRQIRLDLSSHRVDSIGN